jgi:hypothetical protein
LAGPANSLADVNRAGDKSTTAQQVNATRITLTREQLYQRVWEMPIDTLRKEFGVSNIGGKLCRHRQIPVPPRGYWARNTLGTR